MQVKKQQLELDMEQQTGSKSGKEYIKAVHCHPAYLIIPAQYHKAVYNRSRTFCNYQEVRQ